MYMNSKNEISSPLINCLLAILTSIITIPDTAKAYTYKVENLA